MRVQVQMQAHEWMRVLCSCKCASVNASVNVSVNASVNASVSASVNASTQVNTCFMRMKCMCECKWECKWECKCKCKCKCECLFYAHARASVNATCEWMRVLCACKCECKHASECVFFAHACAFAIAGMGNWEWGDVEGNSNEIEWRGISCKYLQQACAEENIARCENEGILNVLSIDDV